MPKYLPPAVISTMLLDELVRWWETDFDVLCATAVADADNRVHPQVASGLRSARWHENWLDALTCTEATLATAKERMTYLGDPQETDTANHLKCVRTALQEARSIADRYWREEDDANPADAHQYSASGIAARWLAWHHRAKAHYLKRALLADRGLTTAPSDRQPRDIVDVIEQAAKTGLLEAPTTPEVLALFAVDDNAFRNTVADDVQFQNARIPELRHPLLLNDWCAALQDLMEIAAPEAGGVEENKELRPLDYDALHALPSDAAFQILNTRRFYRGCEQRMAEWRRVVKRLERDVKAREYEAQAPLREVREDVLSELVTRHSKQHAALCRALEPFLIAPGSDQIDPQKLSKGSALRSELKQLLLSALADGTWPRLLNTPQQQ